MSEKKLIDLGAECVTGDLILNQKTVGRYRHGSFLISDDGLMMLQGLAEAEAGGVEVIEPAKSTHKPRGKKAAPTAEVVEVVEPVAETMQGLNLEDLDAALVG